jgi:hypothetical protein
LSYAPDYQGRGFSLIFAFISASKHRKYFYWGSGYKWKLVRCEVVETMG